MKGVKRYMDIILMVFLKKILIYSKWAVVTIERGFNSGSTLRIFLKFCTMKGAQRYMELILMVFQKKFSFGANGPLWSENGTSS